MSNLLSELEAVVALDQRATPGTVELHTSCSWRRIVAGRGQPFLVPTIDPDRHQNMDTIENAQFVVALVNWFRTHHAEIAAAVRDKQDATDALGMAYVAMNYMGDVINGMDAADPDDVKRVGPAFNAVRRVLSGKDSGVAQLIQTQNAQIDSLAGLLSECRDNLYDCGKNNLLKRVDAAIAPMSARAGVGG